MTARGPASREARRSVCGTRFPDMLALAGIMALLVLGGVILLRALARWLVLPFLPTTFADLPQMIAPLALALCLPLAAERRIAATRPATARLWLDRVAALLLLLTAGALFGYGWDLGPRRTIVADWPLAPVFLAASAGYALAAIRAWRRR